MDILTPEQIHEKTMYLNGRQSITAINKLFRDQDESHKWPVNGKFNATDKAIRKVRQYRGYYRDGLEYALILDRWISSTVNGEV